MIRGLEISIRGDELSRRIGERIQAHIAAEAALDARIAARAGDLPFDVRADDGFKTVGDLERERQQVRDRITQLTLLRDGVIAGELYVLGRRDMRLAELITVERPEVIDGAMQSLDEERTTPAIEGLKLTMTGDELRSLLERRIRDHRRRAESWKEEAGRPVQPVHELPAPSDETCAQHAEMHEWRIDVLRFIRDHVEPTEIYRLTEDDLMFGELMPEKPAWLEDEEQKQLAAVFHLDPVRPTGTSGASA